MIPQLITTAEGRPLLVSPAQGWKFRGVPGRLPVVQLAIGGGRIALTTDEAVRLADALTDAAEALDRNKEEN